MCVQKFHHDPQIHREIHLNAFSMAIFQRDSLWSVGDTITISFLPDNGDLKWYPLSYVSKSLNSAQMDTEREARNQPTYAAAVEFVVTKLVQPIVPKLKLVFVESGGIVRVSFNQGGGSESLVGTACKSAPAYKSTINFGWMDVGTIVHEFSHMLGMLHEHQNPKGGIKWNRDAVYEWAAKTQGWDTETTDSNILDTYASNQITGSVYDPKSVMLYFIPGSLIIGGEGTGQNLRYSRTDLEWLGKTYDSGVLPDLEPDRMPAWKVVSIAALAALALAMILMLILLK